jgi:hypothetical protein
MLMLLSTLCRVKVCWGCTRAWRRGSCGCSSRSACSSRSTTSSPGTSTTYGERPGHTGGISTSPPVLP